MKCVHGVLLKCCLQFSFFFFVSLQKLLFPEEKEILSVLNLLSGAPRQGRSMAAFHLSVTICISFISGGVSGDWNVSLVKAPSWKSHPNGCWLTAMLCSRTSHVTQLLHPERCLEVIQVGMCLPCSAVLPFAQGGFQLSDVSFLPRS